MAPKAGGKLNALRKVGAAQAKERSGAFWHIAWRRAIHPACDRVHTHRTPRLPTLPHGILPLEAPRFTAIILRSPMPMRLPDSAAAPLDGEMPRGLRRHATHPSNGLALVALAAMFFAGLGAGRAEAQNRPDQVFAITRGTTVAPISGKVVRNGLDKVVIEQGDRQREFDSARVVRVVLGRVPATFAEGQAMMARGEVKEAAQSFALAASDTETSDVVRAAARLRAAEALFASGAADATQFREAAAEARRFLDAHSDNREVPAARLLAGRALRCAGDFAAAIEQLRGLHSELKGATPPPGYDVVTVFTAGLEGAHAALANKDSAVARELFATLEGQITGALASAVPGDATSRALAEIQSSVQLGEGYILLSEGRAPQAATFFRGQIDAAQDVAPGPTALRHRAILGLGQAFAAQAQHRAAQLEFARYAAIGLGDPDGHAAALVGAAEAALALGDADAREQARTWLTAVVEGRRGSPSSRRAQELLRTL